MHPIGLITYALNRNPGGIARYTRELLSALTTQGVSPLPLQSGKSCVEDGSIKLRGAGLLPGLLTVGQIEIGWYARRYGLELVHDPTGTAPLYFASQKRVVTVHDAVPYTCPDASTKLDWLIYHYWLPFVVQHVDQILTDSRNSKRDLGRCLGVPMERITVIPLAAGKQFQPLTD